ncbi:CdaR family protein [Isachenkonia alkalipeptolytica]|uniref:YbbR-like protein n=1 Tax=Isachenkonia alkalipeptolytica TaxID=2565777 RepID=A0AA43XNH0_9CLOT|nr:CdaR family protein [Isachenkonia alkalipeptolytica]NBG89569.1 hypothetical protein [Isachenkonia alkalipeptolytica]
MKMMNRMQNNIKDWFGRNLGAKIMAILFALFMWIYVMSVINPTISDNINNVPVELLNMEELESAGIVIKGEEEHTVNVRVTGRSDQVYRISREDIVATADLSGHQNIGANNLQVMVEVDADVEVEHNPRFIRVELEEVVRKQKNVDINILGEPAEGYVLGETRMTPSVIWIEGPESSVNSVEAIIAELQLEEESTDVVANLTLKPVDSRGNEVSGVQLESDVVEVVLPVERTKTVIIEPDLDIEAAEGYTIRNTRVTPRSIMVQGPEDQLEDLTRVDTELIERRDLTENESVEVDLILPDGINLYNERSVTVEIEVSEIVEEAYEIRGDELEIENLGQGLEIEEETLPDSYTVTVTGPEDILENLSREDFRITLDLEGLEGGTHNVEPAIEEINGLEDPLVEVSLDPDEFSLELVGETPDDEENEEDEEDEEEEDEEEEDNG